MAVVTCPSCNEQISDKAKECSHCDASMSETTLPSSQKSVKVQRIMAMQSIQTQTMLALLISIAGFVFYYWKDVEDTQMQSLVGMGAIMFGFIWYFINRVRIEFLNRKYKKSKKL